MNKTGLENAPKIMQDFVLCLNKNTQIKKTTFIAKHRKSIIKVTETPYKLIKWFMFSSAIVAITINVWGYQYVT